MAFEEVFRWICSIFRTPPHGVESRGVLGLFSALDGQQLLVVEGSSGGGTPGV